MSGSAAEARQAAKVLSAVKPEKLRAGDWAPFFTALISFHKLPSADHQAAFILALRHPIAAIGRDEFERLAEFILTALNHPSGKVRQAAVSCARPLVSTLELAQFVVDRKGISAASAARIRRDRRRFAAFLSALESLRDNTCQVNLAKYKYIEELPPSVCKSAETLFFDILEDITCEYVYSAHKEGSLDDLPLTSPDSIYEMERGDNAPPKMPMWLDCAWKRLPCGKADCPVCGRLASHRAEHLDHGDDPQAVEEILNETRGSLEDSFNNLVKHMKHIGIGVPISKIKNPPPPSAFPLAREVAAWTESIHSTDWLARDNGALWPEMAAAADMLWYASMLQAKVYKQLCNKWYLDKGIQYGAFDYEYTKSVISQILNILQKSLQELGLLRIDEKGELLLAASALARLEEKIIKI